MSERTNDAPRQGHTPWEADDTLVFEATDLPRKLVCDCFPDGGETVEWSDALDRARLIAAAPDWKERALALARWVEDNVGRTLNPEGRELADAVFAVQRSMRADAAIRKAEGGE